MLKKEIRKLYRKKRDDVTYPERLRWDDLLLIQFQTLPLPFLEMVFTYYPVEDNNEINSFLFTEYLHFKNPNLQICYPKMHAQTNTMQAIVCNADSIFQANEFNIPEPLDTEIADPEKIDLVLIPLLAFDKTGLRVGYGKGYYDRFLNECRPDCLKIGFSYFEPIAAIDDANDYDIPLDFCITPQQIYVF